MKLISEQERIYVKLEDHEYDGIRGTCTGASEVDIAMPLVISLISDLGILIMPLITIVGLQMPLRKKLGLASVLCFGAL